MSQKRSADYHNGKTGRTANVKYYMSRKRFRYALYVYEAGSEKVAMNFEAMGESDARALAVKWCAGAKPWEMVIAKSQLKGELFA